MKPVIEYLRNQNILLIIYLGDLLIIAKSESICTEYIHSTVTLLQNLGFLINVKKCALQPAQKITFLDFDYNTINLEFSVSLIKKDKIRKTCIIFNTFAQFIGQLIAACPAVKYGFAHTKKIESAKMRALQISKS